MAAAGSSIAGPSPAPNSANIRAARNAFAIPIAILLSRLQDRPELPAARSSGRNEGGVALRRLRYLPWRRSMKGGKVSRKPTASNRKAATFTLTMATVRRCHRRFRASHETSQTMIATVVTPESGPVGLEKFNTFLMTWDASPAKAKVPTAAQPMPAARIAAAPGPFGMASEYALVFLC